MRERNKQFLRTTDRMRKFLAGESTEEFSSRLQGPCSRRLSDDWKKLDDHHCFSKYEIAKASLVVDGRSMASVDDYAA